MSFRNPFAALAVDDDAINHITPIMTPAPVHAPAPVSPSIRRMPYGWRPQVKPTPTPPVVDFPALGRIQERLAQAPVVGAWGKGIDTVRKAAALPQPVYKSLLAKTPVVVSRQVSFFEEDEENEEDEEDEVWGH